MMKLKACSLLTVFCFFAWPATAQYQISGTVTDQKTGSPIEDVQIYDNEAGKSFLTNRKGEFEITGLPSGTYNLFIYALGYEIVNRSFTIEDSSITATVSMEPLNREMTEVAVIAQRDKLFSMQRLRQVEGTSIFAGKKNEVISLNQMTVNTSSNNARQIYSQISGLNIFDSNDAGLQLNIGGRGLDPNRSSNFNIRQNGYDISADVLGYPESYYTPPAEALSEIQVIRGAASLQYGTQFGGLVNFKMKKPNRNEPLEFTTRNSAGSNSLFTTHNSVSGTTGNVGYYGYYNRKEGDSFRPNSGFKSDNIYLYTDYSLGERRRFRLTLPICTIWLSSPADSQMHNLTVIPHSVTAPETGLK